MQLEPVRQGRLTWPELRHVSVLYCMYGIVNRSLLFSHFNISHSLPGSKQKFWQIMTLTPIHAYCSFEQVKASMAERQQHTEPPG